ncbi:hypothetical protein KBB06_00615 [Candidatus Gracilibacteria bacterium]|nr:hypothetical protein [Candidatus Gracilibacteria bacterium]
MSQTPNNPGEPKSLQDELREAVVGGEELEKLNQPENVEKIIDALKDNQASLGEVYDKVRNHIETEVTDEADVIKRAHALLAVVIEKELPKINERIKLLQEKIIEETERLEKARAELKKQLDDKKITKEDYEQKNKELQERGEKRIGALKNLMRNLISLSTTEIHPDVYEEWNKVAPPEDSAPKTVQERELADLTTSQSITEAKEYYDKFTNEDGDAIENAEHETLYFNGKEVKNPNAIRRYREFMALFNSKDKLTDAILSKAEKTAKAEDQGKQLKQLLKTHLAKLSAPEKALLMYSHNAKDQKELITALIKTIKEAPGRLAPERLAVPEINDITSPEDIRNHEYKWKNVVNRFGEKPRAGDTDLYWKAEKRYKRKQPLSAEDLKKYQDFLSFMQKIPAAVNDINAKVNEKAISITGKTSEQIEESARTNAETALSELEAKYADPQARAILYYCMGVEQAEEAYDKLKNMLKVMIATTARKRSKSKETYSELKDDEGNAVTMSLPEYSREKDSHPEVIIEKTNEVLYKLYKTLKADEKNIDIEEFRNALIEIIKTKGEKQLKVKNRDGKEGTISPEQAKAVYTQLLLIKDKDIQDKEILMFLIALRKKPPFVYELVNDGRGWLIKGEKKTGPSVFEDFHLDGSMYSELKEKLNMDRRGFNIFIQKIAPVYENVKDHAQKPNLTVEELNQAVPDANFTQADLEKFRELMNIPLWPEKIAGAFKHSKYIDDSLDIRIPKIQETQGGDIVKKIDVVIVNVEEKVRRIAERIADERLDQEMKELGPQGWTQLWRVDKVAAKWWKRNALEGYRDRYRDEIMARLKTDPRFRAELMRLDRNEVRPGGLWAKLQGAWNMSAPAAGAQGDLNNEMDMIAERFGISFATGDRESYLTSNETIEAAAPAYDAVQTAIRNLAISYANNTINEAQFRNEIRNNIIPQIRALQTPPNEEVIAFLEQKSDATIPLEERRGLLDKLNAHKAGLIALDLQNLEINLAIGRARNVDVKTQVKDLGTVDRISRRFIERLQRNKFLGRFLSPQTVAIMGFGLANIGTQLATSHAVRWGVIGGLTAFAIAPAMAPAIAGIATGCLAGGVMAYFRQNKEQMYLKAQKERRQAISYRPEIDRKGLRPNQAEPTRYERELEQGDRLYRKEDVAVLTNNIDAARIAGDYDALRTSLSRAIALNEMSELSRLDLIRYSDEMSIEQQRLRLVRAIAEGKVQMRAIAATTGRDADMELGNAVATARTDITTNNIELTEANFRRFKRWENLKAAGMGAAIGGSISALTLAVTHALGTFSSTTTVPGPTKNIGTAIGPGDLNNKLVAAGLTPAEINANLHYNPDGSLTTSTINWLNTHHITTNFVPGAPSVTTYLMGGAQMSKSQLLSELSAKGLNPSLVKFDPAGHLDAATLAYLRSNNVHITEILIPGTPGVTGGRMAVASLSADGFKSLGPIHPNDNPMVPHTKGHVLDELRLWWNGKPEVNPDGTCHFSIKNMANPAVVRSHLPPGVDFPRTGGGGIDLSQYKVFLEMTGADGKHYWKEFAVAADGSVNIPSKYFDAGVSGFGKVIHKGSTLNGLKTDAIAVAFQDKHGTWQQLASLRGLGGGWHNPDQINYTGDILTPGKEGIYELSQQEMLTKTDYFGAATAPFIGAKMPHLEYGESKPVDRQPVPQPTPTPTPTPQPEPVPPVPQPIPEPTPTPTPIPQPVPTPEPPSKEPEPSAEPTTEPVAKQPETQETPENKYPVPPEFAPDKKREQIEKELESIEKEIEEMEKELKNLEYNPNPKREKKLKEDLEKAYRRRDELEKALNEILKVEVDEAITTLNGQIDALEKEYDAAETSAERKKEIEPQLTTAYAALDEYEDQREKLTGEKRPRRQKRSFATSTAPEAPKPGPSPEAYVTMGIEQIEKASAEVKRLKERSASLKNRRKFMNEADFNLYTDMIDRGNIPETYPANVDDDGVSNYYLDTLKKHESKESAISSIEKVINSQLQPGSTEFQATLTKETISRGKLSAIRVVARELGYKIGEFKLTQLPNGQYKVTAKVESPAKAETKESQDKKFEAVIKAVEQNKPTITYGTSIDDAAVFNANIEKLLPDEKARPEALKTIRAETEKQYASGSKKLTLKLSKEEVTHGVLSVVRVTSASKGYKIGSFKLTLTPEGLYECVAPMVK